VEEFAPRLIGSARTESVELAAQAEREAGPAPETHHLPALAGFVLPFELLPVRWRDFSPL